MLAAISTLGKKNFNKLVHCLILNSFINLVKVRVFPWTFQEYLFRAGLKLLQESRCALSSRSYKLLLPYQTHGYLPIPEKRPQDYQPKFKPQFQLSKKKKLIGLTRPFILTLSNSVPTNPKFCYVSITLFFEAL